MKLYLNPLSPNVRRVRLTAAWLGLPLDEQVLDFGKGEHKRPDYLALNPNGAVPTLVDGDLVLTESRAIMQHLALKKPESGLLPTDEKARVDVARWQFWDATHFSPQLGTLAFQRILKKAFGMGEPEAAKVDEALAGIRRYAGVLNGQLEGKKYVTGDAPNLADLTLASSLMYAERAEAPIGEFPNVVSWFARITGTDAWKQSAPSM